MFVSELIERVSLQPRECLGARSVLALHAYVLGYDVLLHHQSLPPLRGHVVPHALREATPNMAPECIALLQSEDEREAFEVFLEMRRTALRANQAFDEEAPLGPSLSHMGHGLLEALEIISQRPGMYFGGTRAEYAWAFINGYRTAEEDLDLTSDDIKRLEEFAGWVAQRHSCSHPWFAIFRRHGSYLKTPIDHFFAHLSLFLSGTATDANQAQV